MFGHDHDCSESNKLSHCLVKDRSGTVFVMRPKYFKFIMLLKEFLLPNYDLSSSNTIRNKLKYFYYDRVIVGA